MGKPIYISLLTRLIDIDTAGSVADPVSTAEPIPPLDAVPQADPIPIAEPVHTSKR